MTPAHSIRSRLVRILRNRVVILALLIGAAYLLNSQSTAAFSTYLTAIPNSSTFSCNTCHTGAFADATQIKSDFANVSIGNHMWTLAFANADSDGDGFTN